MMMQLKWLSCHILLQLVWTVHCIRPPNVVIFLADDLGFGDVGCFGNTTLATPNIDRIAREGARLTQHLTASSVCTPSRTALLTGRYPVRSGLVPSSLMPIIPFVASTAGLPDNETTFGEVAKSQGYSTALIGKWHLGMSCSTFSDFCHHPLKHGFDYFYGLPLTNLKDFGDTGESVVISQMPATNLTLILSFVFGLSSCILLNRMGLISKRVSLSLMVLSTSLPLLLYVMYKNITLLNSIMLKDFNVIEQPIRLNSLTRRFTQEGLEFLARQKHAGSPFLLFLSWTHVHTFLTTGSNFSGRSQHGRYGDAVMEMDWGIGEILNALDKHGFTNNTFVYFTSDNGGHVEETEEDGSRVGGYNGVYKGGKTHGAVDGGIRVPTVVRYPPKIKPGTVTHEPTSLMDFLPTVTSLIKAEPPVDRVLDGKDLIPLLGGEEKISRHEFLFHYCGRTIHAVRYRPRQGSDVFKLVMWTPGYLPGQTRCNFVCFCGDATELENPELFNMVTDPGEITPLNVTGSARYQEIVQVMLEAVNTHRASITPVPDQYTIMNLLWRPWLQPCCNFPYCSCEDPKYASLEL